MGLRGPIGRGNALKMRMLLVRIQPEPSKERTSHQMNEQQQADEVFKSTVKRTFDVSFKKETSATPGIGHFVKIGIAFENNNGAISVIIDALPIGKWDGRLMLFPKE